MATPNGNPVKEEEEEEEDDLFFEAGDDDDDNDDVDGDGEGGPSSSANAASRSQIAFGDRLKPPRTVMYSCEALTGHVLRGSVDLEAEYQRDVVWNEQKQSALVDSIYRNYYVPPILFSLRTFTNEDGDAETVRVCIDGKQRLTSIMRFMTNEIPMREPHTGRAFWFDPKSGSRSGLTLSQARRNNFSQIQMVCVEYEELNDEIERDMFRRVQLGVHLSSGEKLMAQKGEWADFARELVKRFLEERDEKGKVHGIIKLDRGKDFLLMAYICLLYMNRTKPDFVPNGSVLEDFFRQCQKSNWVPSAKVKKDIIAALARWVSMAKDGLYNIHLMPSKGQTSRTTPLSPVEFIFTVFMCYLFPAAGKESLSSCFGAMRRKVRREHKDVMINKKNIVTIRSYIRDVEASHPEWTVATDQDGNQRRRRRDDDDDDEDFVPSHSRVRLE